MKKIGNTHIASPICADDILLLDFSAPPTRKTSTTPDLDAQAIATVCESEQILLPLSKEHQEHHIT